MNDEQTEASSTCSLNAQVEELRRNNIYVSESYRFAPDEMTALKMSLVLFAQGNERLSKRLCFLESIRPRIVDIDGRKVRWDAPSELLPVDNF